MNQCMVGQKQVMISLELKLYQPAMAMKTMKMIMMKKVKNYQTQASKVISKESSTIATWIKA
jgi:hypothetical protein